MTMIDSSVETSTQSKYLLWKKNCPLLYKQIQTSTHLWPSLSIEWLPDIDASINGPFNQHRLILGSFSSGFNKFESLKICSIDINNATSNHSNTKIQDFDYDSNSNEFNYSLPIPYKKVKNESPQLEGSLSQQQQQQQQQKPNNALTISQRIPHLGDINRIKHMPSNPDILATSSNSGEIRIFDRTKKSNTYSESDFGDDSNIDQNLDDKDKDNLNDLADILLLHHNTESWTLDWNPLKSKTLATAANDGIIAIWDLETQFTKPRKLALSTSSKKKYATCIIDNPIISTTKHDYGVNEINWLPDHDSLLASIGEDGYYKLTDIRTPQSNVLSINVTLNDNQSPLNCLHINPNHTFQFVSGSTTGSMYIYDMRQTEQSIHHFQNACDGSLTSTKFSPYLLSTNAGDQTTVVASAGSDGVVRLWNIDGCNANDTDSHLLFVHGGHLLEINDLSWSTSQRGLLASCSADNSVHIWEPNL